MTVILLAIMFVALVWTIRLPTALVVTSLFGLLTFAGFFQGFVFVLAYLSILATAFFVRSRRLRREREQQANQAKANNPKDNEREQEAA